MYVIMKFLFVIRTLMVINGLIQYFIHSRGSRFECFDTLHGKLAMLELDLGQSELVISLS